MAMDLLRRFARGIRSDKADAGSHWRTPMILDRGNLGEACLGLDGHSHGSALWMQGEGKEMVLILCETT